MLDTIRTALTGYSEGLHINMECLDVVKDNSTITVKLKFTDTNTGEETILNESLNIPALDKDGKTVINLAIASRRVKVFARKNVVIGTRSKENWAIDYNHHEKMFVIYHKDIDGQSKQVFPRMAMGSKGTYPLYESTAIFNYFPEKKLESSSMNIPDMTPECKEDLDDIAKDFYLSEQTLECLSIYTKRKFKDHGFTPDLLEAILYLIDNHIEFVDKYLPMDFKIGTYEDLISDYIKSARSNIAYSVINSFNRHRDHVSLYKILECINKVGRTDTKDGINVVQDRTDTNAFSVISQGDKTYFKEKKFKENTHESMRVIPKYFVGIIDPVFTADSELVNVKNLVAQSCVISGTEFKVKVMTPEFRPRIITAYEYLSSKVLASSNTDYVHKKLVPDDNGEYSYYQYGDYGYTSDVKEIDYIRYEDSILSRSTALMPFVDKTQPMRIMMGVHMITEQSLPVIGAKPSIVYTGVGKDAYNDSVQVVRAQESGQVLGVGENYINIDGKAIYTPSETHTSNHSVNTYTHQVKEGDYVNEGTVITQSNSFVDNEFATNVPLLTFYTSYHALEYEDAVVIRESAALKFGHMDSMTITIPIKYRKTVLNHITPTDTLDGLSLIKTGSRVNSGDTLFAYSVLMDERLAVGAERAEITKVPFGVDNGRVSSVKFRIFRSSRKQGADNLKYTKYDGLEELLDHFENRAKADLKAELDKTHLSVSQIKQNYEFLEEEPTLSNPVFMEVIINIDYINKVKIADKITNQYGGKGTVSKIVPDDEMLKTEDGRVADIIMSPLALLARANYSQVYEGTLSLVCVEYFNELDRFFNGKSKYTQEQIQSAIDNLYWYEKKNNLRKLYDEGKKYGYLRVRVSAFDKYYTVEKLNELKAAFDIKDEVKVIDPTYNKTLRVPVRIGYQNFYRLHFFADKKNSVRGGNKGVLPKSGSAVVSGYGKIKAEGQSIGEMELWALKSHGLNNLVDYYVEKANKREKTLSDFLMLDIALEEKR